MLTTILIGVAVIAVLIFIHELGHFLTAKASNVKVEEFGIGFPPRIIGIRRGETVYSINAVPFGGFTRMVGEEDPKEPRSLAAKKPPTRLLVLSAGSLINAIFPLFLLTAAFIIPHNVFVGGQVVIEEVQPGSPAAAAGLAPKDLILQVNGTDITDSATLSAAIRENAGKEVALLVQRPDDTRVELKVVPREDPPPGQGPTGIRTAVVNPTFVRESLPLWTAAPRAVSEYWFLFKNGILGIFNAGSGATLTGPIGIVQITGEIAKIGISPLFQAAALLSMALAVTNLLPLPALDGGRMVFVAIEWARRGKRVSPQIERTVHMIGFMLLIGLILVISYNDVARIISGEQLLP